MNKGGISTKTWSLMQSHWVRFSIEILPRIEGQHYTIHQLYLVQYVRYFHCTLHSLWLSPRVASLAHTQRC